MKRNEKEAVVEGLSAELAESRAVFVTDFKGLKVHQIGGLRAKIKDAGAGYQVAKNTLIRRAVEGGPVEPIKEYLTGNNALATAAEDPVGLAKVLVEFAKTNDKLVIKGGILAGKPVSFEQIKAMADLPSREILLGTLLGAMNAVPGGFVRVLAAVPQNFMYALAAIRDQKEQQA